MLNFAHNPLVTAMQKPDFYDHAVDRVDLLETHISWVFLAGDFVYKLKKPLDLGFLDFSTLARRRHFCEEELRLNRRFAPQLYLDVVALGGPAGSLRLHGEPVYDYAVKMKRFPTRQQLDRMQAEGRLTADHIERFATLMARLHGQAPVAGPDQDFGAPELVSAPILQNFTQLKRLLPATMQRRLAELEDWSRAACERLRGDLQQRKQQGFIRECHGDVHLANMAWFEGQPLLFDCIEFSENLRWIDPINDLAFLVMDLDDRGEQILGWHFLNRYLQESADFSGMGLLGFYKIYRAMVRAKVVALRLSQADLPAAQRVADQRLVQSYLDLAANDMAAPRPLLILTHGLSGAGKTTLANQLAPHCGALCIHSDVERKRLHGLASAEASGSAVGSGIYSEGASAATYQRLQDLAETLLKAGVSTIIDATFIKQQVRSRMRRLADNLKVPMIILDLPLAVQELERRIEQRTQQAGQISEATPAVLEDQRAHAEPFTDEELQAVLRVSPDLTAACLARRIAERVRHQVRR